MAEDNIVPLHPQKPGDPNVSQAENMVGVMLSSPAAGETPCLPEGIPQMEVGCLGFDDVEAAFNMRGWLQKACEAAGGKMTGGGFGGGSADLDIELEGHTYNVTIKALKR